MDKQAIRKARSAAVGFDIHMDGGDIVRQMLSRESGLFVVTRNKIIRVRGPDELDPDLEHADVPWEQSVYLPHGARDPLVARTILQTAAMAEMFFAKGSEKHRAMMDISWEVLNSLVSLRVVRERLENRVSEIIALVEADLDSHTNGKSPKPLPIVEYYDIEFRSFVNEMRRVLSKISELFGVLTPAKFESGHFHKALEWARAERGEKSLLALMLAGDQNWIKLWIDVRIAIEHPTKTKFVETLNFSLEKDRKVRLPTWRFVHPDYNMARPQNLLEVFDTAIKNVLTFFENLQLVLLDGHLPSNFKVGYCDIPESERDPEAPMRYVLQLANM
jgi:hypothetical protein